MSDNLNPEVANKVLLANVSNILQKAKSGKPLTKYELSIIEAQAKKAPAPRKDKKERQDTKPFDSIKAAAAVLGVPKFLLQRAKASGQCQDAFRGSRVYLTENLRLWIEAADAEPKEQDKGYWDACLSKQKVEEAEWDFARKRGEFVAKALFMADLMELGSEQKALVRQKLENEYPGLCEGLEPAQRAELKKLGRELADDICRRMQRLVDKWKE